MRSRREENGEATREALLTAARKHFGRLGYARTDISRVARDVRVSTGAIYHHFSSKKGLFQAVAEKLEVEIAVAASTVDDADPWRRLQRRLDSLIDFCAASDVQRITFVEAPQVIGPEAWRVIELRYAFGALHTTWSALVQAGLAKPYSSELAAKIILALLREASSEVARTKHDPAVRQQVSNLVADVFEALRVPSS